ncbi:MAG: entericidin A/B family lipoprotein [Phycisphaeraceae bacterium]
MARTLLVLAAGALSASMLSVSGCHTVEGAGRDVEAVGEGVQGGAERTRPYN